MAEYLKNGSILITEIIQAVNVVPDFLTRKILLSLIKIFFSVLWFGRFTSYEQAMDCDE